MSALQPRWNVLPLARFEWPMILITLILSGVGLLLIFSATAPMGQMGRSLLIKQVTWCSVGLVLMAVLLFFDYHLLERWGVWFYVITIAALVAAWATGRAIGGSKRWIDIGLMRFQPSEFAKLAVVLILAKYYEGRAGVGELGPRDLILPALITAIPVLLVRIQPDFGTAAVIVLIAVSMTVFTGLGRRALFWIAGVAMGALGVLFLLGDPLLFEYQKKRLLTFLDPGYDPLGAGYHIIQSQIAIGSGGALGKGFLQGTQSQLMFLPVKHTDFVFSVLAEEWGFVGCLAVLILFGALLLRGLAISRMARDNFGTLVAFGCTAMLFWHVTINIGMVVGLLPVVGVPLSFLSYGGSSVLAAFTAVSILVNISMRRFSY